MNGLIETDINEEKWRKEFEANLPDKHKKRLPNWQDKYYWESIQATWEGYLAARKKSQGEIDKLSKELSLYDEDCRIFNAKIKKQQEEIDILKIKIEVRDDEIKNWHILLGKQEQKIEKRDKLIDEAIPWFELFISEEYSKWLKKAEEILK